MKKSKLIIPSILTILATVGILAGSTYALFTSEDETNIAVTAGKVKLTAYIADLTLHTPKSIELDGTIKDDTNIAYISESVNYFGNGGSASIANGDTLTLSKIAPGDRASFKIKFTNESNIDIKYRVIFQDATAYTGSPAYKLIDALVVKGNGVVKESGRVVVDWTAIAANSAPSDVTVSIELPGDADNNYRELSSSLKFTVEAVQGNAYTEPEYEWKSLKDTVNQTSVNYYPVLGGSNPQPTKFAYSSDGKTFTSISKPANGYTMADVATYAKSGQLYYAGDSLKVVRSISGISFNDTFTVSGGNNPYRCSTDYGNLQSGIKAKILESETVEAIDHGTNGTALTTNPLINGVSLTDIWNAYKDGSTGFGGENGCFISCACTTTNAYYWNCSTSSFAGYVSRDNSSVAQVLISRTFNDLQV